MRKLLLYKTIIIILTLIGLCPINALSRELDAMTIVINYMSAASCLYREGIMTSEEATRGMVRALEELEGISRKRIFVIMKNENFKKEVEERINQTGGCVKMIKDFERGKLERK